MATLRALLRLSRTQVRLEESEARRRTAEALADVSRALARLRNQAEVAQCVADSARSSWTPRRQPSTGSGEKGRWPSSRSREPRRRPSLRTRPWRQEPALSAPRSASAVRSSRRTSRPIRAPPAGRAARAEGRGAGRAVRRGAGGSPVHCRRDAAGRGVRRSGRPGPRERSALRPGRAPAPRSGGAGGARPDDQRVAGPRNDLEARGRAARELCDADLARVALQEPGSEAMVFRYWTGGRAPDWRKLGSSPARGWRPGAAVGTGIPHRALRARRADQQGLPRRRPGRGHRGQHGRAHPAPRPGRGTALRGPSQRARLHGSRGSHPDPPGRPRGGGDPERAVDPQAAEPPGPAGGRCWTSRGRSPAYSRSPPCSSASRRRAGSSSDPIRSLSGCWKARSWS